MVNPSNMVADHGNGSTAGATSSTSLTPYACACGAMTPAGSFYCMCCGAHRQDIPSAAGPAIVPATPLTPRAARTVEQTSRLQPLPPQSSHDFMVLDRVPKRRAQDATCGGGYDGGGHDPCAQVKSAMAEMKQQIIQELNLIRTDVAATVAVANDLSTYKTTSNRRIDNKFFCQ